MDDKKEDGQADKKEGAGQTKKKKTVRIQIRMNRALRGVGAAGEIVEVPEADAELYQVIGYAIPLSKE